MPMVLNGNDIGFRIERIYGDTPAGALVLRVNGKWVDARFAPGTPELAINTR